MIHFDGDALVYLAGFAADSRNGPFNHSAHNIKLMINKALEATDQTQYKIFLTSKDSSKNFRTELLPSYKKNRVKTCKECRGQELSSDSYIESMQVGENLMKRRFFRCLQCNLPVPDTKPVYYEEIRQYLVKKYGALVCAWGEADDWMGVGNPKWIATHDKDMYQIGNMNFYNLKSGEISKVEGELGKIWLTEKRTLKGEGFKWFCAQMITGDATDNIPKPAKGDGPVWINKIFGPLETVMECWLMVKFYYHATNNSDKLLPMAQLLWVSRERRQLFSEDLVEKLHEISN